MYNDDRRIEGYYPMIRDNRNRDVIQYGLLAEESEYHSYKKIKRFEFSI